MNIFKINSQIRLRIFPKIFKFKLFEITRSNLKKVRDIFTREYVKAIKTPQSIIKRQ